MQPSGHTRLMNFVIGMCKKDEQWIPVLYKMGYELQIIEQTIHVSSGDAVKPDLVTASNALLHSLVFEVKGGKSLDIEQLKHYSNLTPEDLRWLTWVSIYDKTHLQLDVCICDLEENHDYIRPISSQFPILTFGITQLTKEGSFKNGELNRTFKNPISLSGKSQPLSYYPFSDQDDNAYIAIHVLRTILSLALKDSKNGHEFSEKELKDKIVTFDDVMASNFNYVWKTLSTEHRNSLRAKIEDISRKILEKDGIKQSLGIIQQKKGYKIARNLDQFKREAIGLIEELESERGQTGLTDFPH